jgi:uncharacterized protein
MSGLTPVSAGERIEALDVMRGFALLGILAMNIRAMAAPYGAYVYPYALFEYEGASRVAYAFTTVVFDLKMMGLFSMLFGAGVLLYAAKPTASGRPPRALWLRRMFWLLAIGLVHAYLVWDGDILVPYSLCGVLLLWWVRRLPAWGLLALSLVLLGVGAAASAGEGLAWESMPESDRAKSLELWMPTPEQSQTQVDGMLGGYFDVVRHRAPSVLMGQTFSFLFFFFWRCGGMMLLGMALYKWGFLDGRRPESVYVTTAGLGLAAGLVLAYHGLRELERVRFATPARSVPDLWNYTGAVLASVGYAALLVLLVKHSAAPNLRRALAAVGQMALTNYLLQSVLASVLFLGWGFGLAGRLDYADQLVIVAGLWLFQLVVSPIWLARFRFGPAEWLWRSLSYWRLQPMRR